MPPIFADIAASLPADLWGREQQSLDGKTVNKVTYRTPDYMLASAQSYRPGQAGQREHIWQATLGPQSVVFVNHPGSAAECDQQAPNFWLGNGSLPRAAQWKDALIVIYNIDDAQRMEFTHAYFPTIEFDESILRERTAFARKDAGYIALTALNGLELIQEGRTAKRELRSAGRQAIWLCQMGRESLDGSFDAFQQRVLAAQIIADGLHVKWQTIRGDALTLGWHGDLEVNGESVALQEFKLFDNPFTQADFPCLEMEIRTDEYLLKLDFGDLA